MQLILTKENLAFLFTDLQKNSNHEYFVDTY